MNAPMNLQTPVKPENTSVKIGNVRNRFFTRRAGGFCRGTQRFADAGDLRGGKWGELTALCEVNALDQFLFVTDQTRKDVNNTFLDIATKSIPSAGN